MNLSKKQLYTEFPIIFARNVIGNTCWGKIMGHPANKEVCRVNFHICRCRNTKRQQDKAICRGFITKTEKIICVTFIQTFRSSEGRCCLQSSPVRCEDLRWESIKENKKVRKKEKKELNQEIDQENKKATKKKRKNFLFFLITFLVEFFFSCFLTFLFSFINSYLRFG